GAMVPDALQATDTLAAEGISCEVVDVRTLAPMDAEAVLVSVRKTGRALVVHEARRTAGVGAEISATISEHAFESLDAPITRLTAPDTPTPYSPPLEKAYRPDAESIAAAARNLASY
ncbi:MAG: transketolase C-terminal domain-containing protein, partial [Anaerolineales bacterium]|nr:transketolase C-terminal domain-containing protein [Anaerolineales bacterium]